jgi:hypothetical protein
MMNKRSLAAAKGWESRKRLTAARALAALRDPDHMPGGKCHGAKPVNVSVSDIIARLRGSRS